MTPLLEIRDLHVAAEGQEILRGVDLSVGTGEIHALMGPNGAGKSTLAGALMGHPSYTVTSGSILLDGEDVTAWATDVRSKAGLFLAFQYPESIEGVSVTQFLRQAMAARTEEDVSALEVRVLMTEWMQRLGMDSSFASRHLNQGFSGGEKKRNEILQMALLKPRWPCSTRPTPAWTSTPCGWSAGACTRCATSGPSSASWPSRTTSACWTS
jgi:Fe-S cluster assembly ATP-binding protein